MLRLFFCAVLLALPLTARSSPWRGPAVTIGAGGERFCAKHHRQLAPLTLYGPGGGVCVLFQPNKQTEKARAASPNALPLGLQHEKNQLYSRAVDVTYCTDCESDVLAAARKAASSRSGN